MFERTVYDTYGLYPSQRFFIGKYEGFQTENSAYLLLPKEELLLAEEEMLTIISYLQLKGDQSILKPIKTLQGDSVSLIDGQRAIVCELPLEVNEAPLQALHEENFGKRLAHFHIIGEGIPFENSSVPLFNNWNKLWEVRFGQLEDWYKQLLIDKPRTNVDELFIFSFPYFMGLTENAIQFVVDTMIDERDGRFESFTVCHRKFTEDTWLILNESGTIGKRPTEFVLDHPSRDLSEWIRWKRVEDETFQFESVERFLYGYELVKKLSPYSWRMFYARLLFPLHYIEAIETYYKSQVQEVKDESGEFFLQIVESESNNEKLLRDVAEHFFRGEDRLLHRLPKVDWL